MKKIFFAVIVSMTSVISFAADTLTYTDPTDIFQVLQTNQEIQAVPVAAQISFGKAVMVTSVTLSKTQDGCFKRAKVTFIQSGQGNRPRSEDSNFEFNLKECAYTSF